MNPRHRRIRKAARKKPSVRELRRQTARLHAEEYIQPLYDRWYQAALRYNEIRRLD